MPYAENLVTLLIADLDALGSTAPSEEEIVRVLSPQGAAYLRSGGKWQVVRKPRPPTMDQWSHYDHGPGGNPVSSDTCIGPVTALRWYAPPTFTSAGSQQEPGFRLAGGRVIYSIKDYGIKERLQRGAKNHLVCRDAYNGLLLWQRSVAPEQFTPYRHEFVADGDQIYVKLEATGPMVALDAATGKTRLTYSEGAIVQPLQERDRRLVVGSRHLIARVYKGRLIQAYRSTIHVLDTTTGKKLWGFSEGKDRDIPLLVAGEDKVFAVIGNPSHARVHSLRYVLCRSVGSLQSTGRRAQHLRHRRISGQRFDLLFAAEVLVFGRAGRIHGDSGRGGAEAHACGPAPGEGKGF